MISRWWDGLSKRLKCRELFTEQCVGEVLSCGKICFLKWDCQSVLRKFRSLRGRWLKNASCESKDGQHW